MSSKKKPPHVVSAMTYAERLAYEKELKAERDAAAPATRGGTRSFTKRKIAELGPADDLPSSRAILAIAKKHCSRMRATGVFCLEQWAPSAKHLEGGTPCEVCAFAQKVIAASNQRQNPAHSRGEILGAELRYRAGHWGKGGKEKPRELAVANPFDPKAGPVVVIGKLIAIEYETDKLGDGLSVYRHEVESKDARIGHVKNGRLVIGGEKIRMTVRGIVG